MKPTEILFIFIALAFLIPVAGAATSVVSATNPQDAAALVYVSGYDLTPGVFYPDETGTLTVYVTNAANTSVVVSQPNLIDASVDVINKGAYATSTSLGPGATASFTFVIRADGPDGTYLPLFTVSTNTYGTSAVHSQIKLKVDSTDVRASVSKKPDTFSLEKTDTVNVSVVNPRLGEITDVLIIASSPGNDISPTEEFINSIPAGSSVKVPFAITPHRQSDATFNISFRNGDNVHTTSVVLPLNLGTDKSAAIPVINNVKLAGTAGTYTMTGEIGNAGITDAQGMIVSVTAPAKPAGSYQSCLIGPLESNDLTRFTLTFTSNDLSAIPVQVLWKDSQGNTHSSITTLDLRTFAAGSPAADSTSGQIVSYPVIAGCVLAIAAIVLYAKRKWIASKLKKQ